MSKPDKPNPNLPPRRYYRLSQSAELLNCTVDDLIHWGANGYVELCAKPDLVCDKSSYEPSGYMGEIPTVAWSGESGDETSVFSEDTDEDEGYELLGLWMLSMPCLAKLEQQGSLEGVVFFLMADTGEGDTDSFFKADNMMVWAKLKDTISSDDLYITRCELEKIQNGARKSKPTTPHGGNTQHGANVNVHPRSHDFYHRVIAWLGSKAGAIKQPNQASIDNLTALENDWKAKGFIFDRDKVSAVLRTASEKIPHSDE